jgi:hypothetical protein
MLAALLLATRILFDNTWQAAPSDGVDLRLTAEGGVMRMDFDFHGHAGWAAMRKPIEIAVPANYRFHFRTRGETPANTLEFKLVDPSGENVWWYRKPGWEWPRDWTDVNIDKRKIEFAWGPSPTKVATKIAFVEITVTAVKGGKGTVWLDDLTFEELGAESGTPVASASSSAPSQTPDLAVDGKGDTAWRAAAAGEQWLALDFRQVREFGGLVVDWAGNDHATSYAVETSADGSTWTTARDVRGGNGGRDYLQTPGAAARYVRLHFREGAAYAIREIAVQPPEFGDAPIAVYQMMARDALRGHFPRQLRNEFAYWTVFGVNGDEGRKPLLSEDGVIETPGGFTIEPFLRVDGRLFTWADVTTSHSLERRVLPMPSATWQHPQFTLEVSPHGVLVSRYRYRNTSPRTEHVELFLTIRPLRVTPPWHSLNIDVLTAPIRSIEWSAPDLVVDGVHMTSSEAPQRVVTSTFDGGDASELFDAPARSKVEDPQRHASALLIYRFEVAPGAHRDVELSSGHNESREKAASSWAAVADHVTIDIAAARNLVDTVKANLGYMLVTRDGPAIRGGPRNYDRSWIRDGSLSSSVLLRFGFAKEVGDYIRWFAPYQFADGKVPCCVDDRGADPVAENDSHGEFIYLVAAYARLTGDLAIPREVWPHVEAAANYIDTLRRQRTTEKYRDTQFYGLMPESISHEGYSAKPMHSYWDDFWALRGLKDAAWLANELGHAAAAKRFAAIRDEFDRDLHASIERSLAVHHINYIPGAADIGDFDPTSTTIALEPVLDKARLPKGALEAEFERYWTESEARMNGTAPWTLYTPYELRNVGAMVRLGWRDRAQRLLYWFLQDRRPLGWLNWGEVVAREYRDPKYLGDIPHTWVGSDYVRTLLDMLFYEREDDALVIGAGVPQEWIDRGIHVRGVHTVWGPLTLDITKAGAKASVTKVPPGGIVFELPGRKTKVVKGRSSASY